MTSEMARRNKFKFRKMLLAEDGRDLLNKKEKESWTGKMVEMEKEGKQGRRTIIKRQIQKSQIMLKELETNPHRYEMEEGIYQLLRPHDFHLQWERNPDGRNVTERGLGPYKGDVNRKR